VSVPVDAVIVVEVAPAGTVAVAGTARAAALLARLTVAPPAGAALDRVIVQVVVAFDGMFAAELWMPDNVAGVTSESAAVLETPPKDPVTVAAWSAVKFEALAVNVALLAFAGIASDAGTVRWAVLELRVTVVVVGAGPDKEAVQVADALGARLPGLQATAVRLSVGVGVVRVIVPLTPVTGTLLPAADTPRALLTVMTAVLMPCASVTDTFATTPLAMAVAFPPVARHV
jgi:hypothetical protein